MLAKLTVKVWSGKPGVDTRIKDATNGDTILFGTSRINGVLVRASTKSSFLFHEDIHNHKEKPSYVEAEETAAAVVADADKTWQSAFVTLNFYPNNDTAESVVATRVNCESIAYCYKDSTSPTTRSFVVFYEGGKRREKLCNYNLNQIYSLVDDGNLTTT